MIEPYCRCPGCGMCDAAEKLAKITTKSEEHEARIRAKALREAAEQMDANGQDLVWDAFFREGFAEQVTAWLRALADEAERGTR